MNKLVPFLTLILCANSAFAKDYYELRKEFSAQAPTQLLVIGGPHLPLERTASNAAMYDTIKKNIDDNAAARDIQLQGLIEELASGRNIVFLHEAYSIFDVSRRAEIIENCKVAGIPTLDNFIQQKVTDLRGWDSGALKAAIGQLQLKQFDILRSQPNSGSAQVTLMTVMPLLINQVRNFLAVHNVRRILELYKEKGALIVMFMGSEHTFDSDFTSELETYNISYKIYRPEISEDLNKEILRTEMNKPNYPIMHPLNPVTNKYYNYKLLNDNFYPILRQMVSQNPPEQADRDDLADVLAKLSEAEAYLVKYGKISREKPAHLK